MGKIKVLFVCVHNSARSQMAEAFLNSIAADRFEAESAGLDPAPLNPLVMEVMKEVGLDISGNRAKGVFDKYKRGELFSYVIAVCDVLSAETCPIFPGILTKTLHWDFEDPASFTGSYEERLAKTRQVRDKIKERIEIWVSEVSPRPGS